MQLRLALINFVNYETKKMWERFSYRRLSGEFVRKLSNGPKAHIDKLNFDARSCIASFVKNAKQNELEDKFAKVVVPLTQEELMQYEEKLNQIVELHILIDGLENYIRGMEKTIPLSFLGRGRTAHQPQNQETLATHTLVHKVLRCAKKGEIESLSLSDSEQVLITKRPQLHYIMNWPHPSPYKNSLNPLIP